MHEVILKIKRFITPCRTAFAPTLGRSGHAPVPVWIPILLGGLAIAGFVMRQLALQKRDEALLDLRTFRSSSFTLAVVMVVVVMAALFGSLILLPIYLQQILALDPLTVGLTMLPGGIMMGAIAPVVGSLFDRFGPTPLVPPGMVVAAAALWGMATFSTDSPLWWVIVVQVGLNLGLGFVFTPLLTSALGSLPPHLYPHGSATVSTLQQVAGAAGTALFVTLMSVGAATASAEGAGSIAATAAGIHIAFTTGASIASAAILLALFVRRPAAVESGETSTRTPVH